MDEVSRLIGSARWLGHATESSSMSPIPYRSLSHQQVSSSSQPSILPQSIGNDIEHLQRFMKEVLDTTCHKCHANITPKIEVRAIISHWLFNSLSADGDISLTTQMCGKCQAVTCLGCGPVARHPTRASLARLMITT
jgi:hypothetical protein